MSYSLISARAGCSTTYPDGYFLNHSIVTSSGFTGNCKVWQYSLGAIDPRSFHWRIVHFVYAAGTYNLSNELPEQDFANPDMSSWTSLLAAA